MQLKWIGAVCVIVSCGGFGFLIASQQIRRMRLLQNLIAVLDCMECELRYRCTPLPQLCRVSVHRNHGILWEIFCELAEELESQISPDPERCMASVLDRQEHTDAVVRRILMGFGANLGRFNMEGQLRGLEETRTACQNQLAVLMENKERRLRSYQTLGLCAGAAIAILFV